MKIDAGTKAFKLIKHRASYLVYQVAGNGSLLQLVNSNGDPVVVRSVIHLRDRLGALVSKGKITDGIQHLPIGF